MNTIEQYQPTELRTITPELGLFVVTGSFDEVKLQEAMFVADLHCKSVQPSSFDRMLSVKRIKRLGLF